MTFGESVKRGAGEALGRYLMSLPFVLIGGIAGAVLGLAIKR